MTFGARLDAALDARGSLCVGIDPHPALLEAWGLSDDVDGLARFADICVEAFAGTARGHQAAVGVLRGVRLGRHRGAGTHDRGCRAAGALVLLDVKRGDIGSTMAAYAHAYLDPASPLAADAITVSPYLGVGSLEPAFDAVSREHGTRRVRPRRSPPTRRARRCSTRRTRTVGRGPDLVDEIAARNAGADAARLAGRGRGATIGTWHVDLDALNGSILAPGVGAQGGTADDVRRIFAGSLRAVLPSVSREVLRRGPDVRALHAAAGGYVEQFAFLRA